MTTKEYIENCIELFDSKEAAKRIDQYIKSEVAIAVANAKLEEIQKQIQNLSK